MTVDEAKAALARAVKRAWPNVAKASDLPFQDYWKKQMEWLTFHAPRIGDKLLEQFVDYMIATAQAAEREGQAPKPWIVPDKVKEIWKTVETPPPPANARSVGVTGGGIESKSTTHKADADAGGGREAEVRQHFAQGRLL